MGFLKIVLWSSVLVALLALYVRPRFPDKASNHGLKTCIGLGVSFLNAASYLGGLVGLSPINITRTMVSVTLLWDAQYEDVKEYTTKLGGIQAFVLQPATPVKDLRPGIIHIHGGGWALLSPYHYAPLLREIVRQTQSVVISIQYRRAPEALFPAPLDDCIKATRYFLQHTKRFGVDPNRIGIKGDSAGGNLAMAVSLNITRQPVGAELKFVQLDYPALQLLDFNLPSFRQFEHGPSFLDKTIMINYWLTYAFGHRKYFHLLYNNHHVTDEISKLRHYVSIDLLPDNFTTGHVVPDKDPKDANNQITIPEELTKLITNPMYAPLTASDEDLARLPPAYIMTAEFDPLRDEGFILAERLRKNKVQVKHKHWETEQHGFLNFVDIDDSAMMEVKAFAEYFNETVNS